MLSNAEHISRALQALAEKMDDHGCQPTGLIVCGGAALNVAGLVARPTRDVDILAIGRERSGRIELETPDLPPDLRRCVSEVAVDLRLPSSPPWLNTGPRRLLERELPAGIEKRLRREDFGPRLRVYWLARVDLVCLKLFAAADDRARRNEVHAADLAAMGPTYDELDGAVEWLRKQREYEELKPSLHRLLIHMGHEDLAYYL